MTTLPMNRKRAIRTAAFLVLASLAAWLSVGGFFRNRLASVEKTEVIMDTSVTVKLFASSRREGERLIDLAFVEARRVERIMEPYKGDGELKRLNARDRAGSFPAEEELRMVLGASLDMTMQSHGAFDPTIGTVKQLWNFEEGGPVPPSARISEALAHVGPGRVAIKGDSIWFADPEVQLDLGGSAKGYAVDRMIAVLRDAGVESCLVNAGGDIRTAGEKPGGDPWVIAVRHPRMSRTLVMKPVPLPAVATSGDYERFFVENGIRYHHILDPKTGYPTRECASVTAWASTALEADILSTTIFVLGPEEGLAFAENRPDTEALIFYERDGELDAVMTSGIVGVIDL